MANEEFFTGSSGAAKSVPQQASSLRKNGFVLMEKNPCKIVEMSVFKTGKHGRGKVHLVGIDIFDGKKHEEVCPSTHNMQVPNILRKEFMVISIDPDGYIELLDTDTSDTRSDIRGNDGNLKEIHVLLDADEDVLVTILSAMDREEIVSIKKGNFSRN